ncbi:MAG: hypothetical protein IPK19_21910 [Chloroflexi bacterium]|nr:hypothetical protein [Chloroflexota bacterium]
MKYSAMRPDDPQQDPGVEPAFFLGLVIATVRRPAGWPPRRRSARRRGSALPFRLQNVQFQQHLGGNDEGDEVAPE